VEGTEKPHADRHQEIKIGWNYEATSKLTSLPCSVSTVFVTLSNRTEWWHILTEVVPATVWVGNVTYSTAEQVAAIACGTLTTSGVSNIE